MIELKLPPEEVQKIVNALAHMPYQEVYELIPNILGQAHKSTTPTDAEETK